MKIILTESQLSRLIKEQGWTDPVKAASGPQKCGITKGQDNGSYDRESRALDKEAARQDKVDAKNRSLENKNFLSLSHDRYSDPLDRQSKKNYYKQYQDFMSSNPGVLTNGEGFNTEQKYAVVTKVMDFLRKVPGISYTVQLKRKYGLGPQSSFQDVMGVINKMGGWSSFVDWMNNGGPVLK